MKLNNRGYLLVEIIVASVLAMSMMYFLLEITINLRNINEDYYVSTKLETDKILMTRDVMNDLNSNTLVGVVTSDNEVIFTFKDSRDNTFKTKMSIDNNIYKYGKLNESLDYENSVYVKKFDDNLNIGNIEIENLCYYNSTYQDCSTIDISQVSKGLLKVKVGANTIYSNIDYGINLIIYYNMHEVSIKTTVIPNISSKNDNFTIEEGSDYEIIDEYFTYDNNGGSDIVSKKCIIDDIEVSNTSNLESGEYNVSCSVTNSDDLSNEATTNIKVEEKQRYVYMAAKDSGNAYTTTAIYNKSNNYVKSFSNEGPATAIGCDSSTCYVAAKGYNHAYTTTTLYKENRSIKSFDNDGTTSNIGCSSNTCYISSQSTSNAYSTTAIYKDNNYVSSFNNDGVVKAIGCSSNTCYIAVKGYNHAYTTTTLYKENKSIKSFDNNGVVSAIGCSSNTCYISSQSTSNAYSTTAIYKDNNYVSSFNNDGVVSHISCNTSVCYISSQPSNHAYSTTYIYKNNNLVKSFNNAGVVKASGGSNH